MSGEAEGPGSGEDRLIARHFRPLARHPAAFGLADDAAAFPPPAGCDLVLKTDPIIAGVHFLADESGDAVARKALRVNLSDLAAKGAQPAGFLLALALPGDIGEAWLTAFAAALGEDAEAFGCPLLGGDTDRTPGPLTVSITAFGTLPHGTMVRRNGARAGDRVVVTGTIGDAALGLRLRRDPGLAARWTLDPTMAAHLVARYRIPQPRNAVAELVRRHASGAMDISDGFAGDLAKLTRASGVRAEIDLRRLPLSPGARAALAAEPGLLATIVGGGDDYEILCTVSPAELAPFVAAAAVAGVPVTEVGHIAAGEGFPAYSGDSGQLQGLGRPSYSHF